MEPDSVLDLQSVFFVGKAWAKNFSITLRALYRLIDTVEESYHQTKPVTAAPSRACLKDTSSKPKALKNQEIFKGKLRDRLPLFCAAEWKFCGS